MRGTSYLLGFFTKLTLVLLVVACGLFVGGFFRFANTVAQSAPPANPVETQAVVALTGGSSRIAQALDLVEKDKSKRLLITGVDAKTSLNALKALNESRRATFDCCVEVERVALDTVGNAEETGKWMAANKFNSITLVTSDYHMPRSLVEFRRKLPEATIQPFPVKLPRLQAKDWYTDGETVRLMVAEYIKYVGALSRDYVNRDTLKSLRASMSGA
ncbi:MAG: YdcF family protein [Pseudomonadota bacterium]